MFVMLLGDVDERGHEPRVFTCVKGQFKQAVDGCSVFPASTAGECPAHLSST